MQQTITLQRILAKFLSEKCKAEHLDNVFTNRFAENQRFDYLSPQYNLNVHLTALLSDELIYSIETTSEFAVVLLYVHLKMQELKLEFEDDTVCLDQIRTEFHETVPQLDQLLNKSIPYYYWGIGDVDRAEKEFVSCIDAFKEWRAKSEQSDLDAIQRDHMNRGMWESDTDQAWIRGMYQDISLMMYHFGYTEKSIEYFRESLQYFTEDEPVRNTESLVLAFKACSLGDNGKFEEAAEIWKHLLTNYSSADCLRFSWEFVAADFNELGAEYDQFLIDYVKRVRANVESVSRRDKQCLKSLWQSLCYKCAQNGDLESMDELLSLFPKWKHLTETADYGSSAILLSFSDGKSIPSMKLKSRFRVQQPMIDALSCPTYYYSRPEFVDNGNCIRFKEFTGVYLGLQLYTHPETAKKIHSIPFKHSISDLALNLKDVMIAARKLETKPDYPTVYMINVNNNPVALTVDGLSNIASVTFSSIFEAMPEYEQFFQNLRFHSTIRYACGYIFMAVAESSPDRAVEFVFSTYNILQYDPLIHQSIQYIFEDVTYHDVDSQIEECDVVKANSKYDVCIINRRFERGFNCKIYRPDLVPRTDDDATSNRLLDYSVIVQDVIVHKVINNDYIAGVKLSSINHQLQISLVVVNSVNGSIVHSYLFSTVSLDDTEIVRQLKLSYFSYSKLIILMQHASEGSCVLAISSVADKKAHFFNFVLRTDGSTELNLQKTVTLAPEGRDLQKVIRNKKYGYYLLSYGGNIVIFKPDTDSNNLFTTTTIALKPSVASSNVVRAQFSKNYVILLMIDSMLYQFNIHTGKLISVFNHLDTYCNQMIISEDESTLTVCSEIGTVYTLDLVQENEL